jgi:hypothetical protein
MIFCVMFLSIMLHFIEVVGLLKPHVLSYHAGATFRVLLCHSLFYNTGLNATLNPCFFEQVSLILLYCVILYGHTLFEVLYCFVVIPLHVFIRHLVMF